MQKIQLIDLKAQYLPIKDKIQQAVDRVLASGHFILSSEVKELEEQIADYIGTKYAVGVANGTDALVLALKAQGIGPGDEVITSPYSFFASAECISHLGAKPIFVDIDPKTYCLDVEKIEQVITKNTKAIIPVHIFGQACDMDPIIDIADKYGLFVLEDACQAIGGEYRGRKLGSIGQAAAFSFYPTKNLGCYGDGGMITTNDQRIAETLRILRVHGSKPKYYHHMLGYNSRLDALQAAVLKVKLPYLDHWNKARKSIAQAYNQLITNPNIIKPYEADYASSVYHLYVIQVNNREEFISYMEEKQISTGVYYPIPLHLQDVYKNLGYTKGDLPISELIAKQSIAIPLYPQLTREAIEYVADTINRWRGEEATSYGKLKNSCICL